MKEKVSDLNELTHNKNCSIYIFPGFALIKLTKFSFLDWVLSLCYRLSSLSGSKVFLNFWLAWFVVKNLFQNEFKRWQHSIQSISVFSLLCIAREEQKHFVEIESRFGRHFYNEGHSVYNMLLYGTYFLSIIDFLQFIFH